MCLANVLPIKINLSANYHSEQLLFSSSLCARSWHGGGRALPPSPSNGQSFRDHRLPGSDHKGTEGPRVTRMVHWVILRALHRMDSSSSRPVRWAPIWALLTVGSLRWGRHKSPKVRSPCQSQAPTTGSDLELIPQDSL